MDFISLNGFPSINFFFREFIQFFHFHNILSMRNFSLMLWMVVYRWMNSIVAIGNFKISLLAYHHPTIETKNNSIRITSSIKDWIRVKQTPCKCDNDILSHFIDLSFSVSFRQKINFRNSWLSILSIFVHWKRPI